MEKTRQKHGYRLCPCDSCDVEGIQSWLEDLAAQGLFLEEDGLFCGVFTFARGIPRRVRYRLDVAQKQKARFLEGAYELTEEEVELYRSMGWEYLVRYGEFRIYRSFSQEAPELNTENQTHAVTIGFLKRKLRGSSLWVILIALFWVLHAGSALRYFYMNLVHVGLEFTAGVYGALMFAMGKSVVQMVRLRRLEKRLLAGESLRQYREWERSAMINCGMRLLTILLCCGIGYGLLSTLARAGEGTPLEEYHDPPFVTLEDVFDDNAIVERRDWLDYGTYKRWDTAFAKNVEWNENADITTAEGESYYGILMLSYHETAASWLAKGLEEDYYVRDASRYRGKRFLELEAPELGVDSVRVYTSYGTRYVLMREGNRVVHAMVHLDNGANENQWILWAEAMADQFLE